MRRGGANLSHKYKGSIKVSLSSLFKRVMSSIADAIQNKCMSFGDRVIKLNDSLLKEAANAKPTYKMVKGKRVYEKAVPVYLQSVSNLCNQLLRAGTEARESLYWIDLLHRNNYIDDKEYNSIYAVCEELVKILVTRCKRINEELEKNNRADRNGCVV